MLLRTETEKGLRSVDATLFVKSIVGHLETVFPDKMLVSGITQAEGSREITNHSRGLFPDQQQAGYPLRTENCNHAIVISISISI
ncbi:Elongation factor 1-alpha [Trichinella pseudospiralis]